VGDVLSRQRFPTLPSPHPLPLLFTVGVENRATLYARRTSLIFLNGIYASVKFMLAKYYWTGKTIFSPFRHPRCLHHHHRLHRRLLLLPRRSGIILSSKSIKRRCRLFFYVFCFLSVFVCTCLAFTMSRSLARENIWDWLTLIAVRGKVVQLNAASFDSRIFNYQPQFVLPIFLNCCSHVYCYCLLCHRFHNRASYAPLKT